MAQCEMCGDETSNAKTAKIEGAELEVCSDCADFGTEIDTGSDDSTSTKYSTSGNPSSSSSGSSTVTSSAGGSAGGSSSSDNRRDEMFRDVDQVVPDYDERIREAREASGLTQAELADQLNEKASFIRKLERGESLPNDKLQRKLEGALDIDLTGGAGGDEDDWSSGESTSGVTLGDVVKRKD